MSSPTPRDPGAVPALIWLHADEALTAEEEAARLAAGPPRNQLDDILQRFRLRWIREFGPLASRVQRSGAAFTALMLDLAADLDAVQVGQDVITALVVAAAKAFRLGTRQAYAEAGLDAEEHAYTTDLATLNYAAGIAAKARELVARADLLASTTGSGSFTAVNRAVLLAHQGANQLDRAARTLTNTQLNAGISTVAQQLGGRELWVAERNACVHCLALSGRFPDEAGVFNAELTFGRRALTWVPEGGLMSPPRHPNCRCRLTPWFGHDTVGAESVTHDWAGAIQAARAAGDQVAEDAAHRAAAAARESSKVDLPAALRREAERSVLNGWALPSEPTSVRTQAADRLLNRISSGSGVSPSGWRVPTSVRKGAEKDVQRGQFRTRAFPK